MYTCNNIHDFLQTENLSLPTKTAPDECHLGGRELIPAFYHKIKNPSDSA